MSNFRSNDLQYEHFFRLLKSVSILKLKIIIINYGKVPGNFQLLSKETTYLLLNYKN